MADPTAASPHTPADEPSNEDLRRLSRRGLLGLSLGALAACAAPTAEAPSVAAGPSDPPVAAGTGDPAVTQPGCVLIPEETSGPFPIDLSADPTFVRSDIAEGRPGVPLELTLTLVDVDAGCAPLQGVRVDVWHTDAAGDYSGFEAQPSGSTVGQTFCRGIQTTGADGTVTFRTIYPGWYPGRVAHVHLEAFLDGGRLVAGTQVAFPDEVTATVHGTATPYDQRGLNPTVATVADDFLFAEGAQAQTAEVTGDTTTGLRAALQVGIRA